MSAGQVEHSATPGSHHVKFNLQEEEVKNHHENLDIVNLGINQFDINLGYLKIDHYYRVTFCLELQQTYQKFVFLKEKSSKRVSLKELRRVESSSPNFVYEIAVVFYAFKEKHDKETIYFSLDSEEESMEVDENKSNLLEIHLEAMVLGAHQGTPLLRNGIAVLPSHSNNHLNSGSNERLHFNIN